MIVWGRFGFGDGVLLRGVDVRDTLYSLVDSWEFWLKDIVVYGQKSDSGSVSSLWWSWQSHSHTVMTVLTVLNR